MVVLFGNDFIVSNLAVLSLLSLRLSLFIMSVFVFLLASSPVEQFCVFVLKEAYWLTLGVDDLSNGKTFSLVGKFNFLIYFLHQSLGFQRYILVCAFDNGILETVFYILYNGSGTFF